MMTSVTDETHEHETHVTLLRHMHIDTAETDAHRPSLITHQLLGQRATERKPKLKAFEYVE